MNSKKIAEILGASKIAKLKRRLSSPLSMLIAPEIIKEAKKSRRKNKP